MFNNSKQPASRPAKCFHSPALCHDSSPSLPTHSAARSCLRRKDPSMHRLRLPSVSHWCHSGCSFFPCPYPQSYSRISMRNWKVSFLLPVPLVTLRLPLFGARLRQQDLALAKCLDGFERLCQMLRGIQILRKQSWWFLCDCTCLHVARSMWNKYSKIHMNRNAVAVGQNPPWILTKIVGECMFIHICHLS